MTERPNNREVIRRRDREFLAELRAEGVTSPTDLFNALLLFTSLTSLAAAQLLSEGAIDADRP